MAVETLVERLPGMGIEALALTDINNSMGMVDFVKACSDQGIHPIAGIEYRNGDRYLYTGIARNPNGFRELNDFLSYHNETGLPLPERHHHWRMYGLSMILMINPWQVKKQDRKLRDQELIGVRPGEVNKILTSRWRSDRSRLIVRHPVTFLHQKDHALHRHLRAIDHNILLSQLKPEQLARESEVLLPPDLLRCAYDDYSEIWRNSERILKDCWMGF